MSLTSLSGISFLCLEFKTIKSKQMEELTLVNRRINNVEIKLDNLTALLSIQKAVLNLNEACLFTGLSKSHLYKLTCKNSIPHYKQAKHLYFERAELESWLKANRSKSVRELENEASTYVTLNR